MSGHTMPLRRSAGRPALTGLLALAVAIATAAVGLTGGAAGASQRPTGTTHTVGAHTFEIVRDAYGVPHVYGATAEDVAAGFGYAQAQDHLFNLTAHSYTAKGQLSHLFPGINTTDPDHSVRFYTYTEAERARKFATYPPDAQQVIEAFSAGVQTRIEEVTLNPTLVPQEFVTFGLLPIPSWTLDDTLAVIDLVALQSSRAGGGETSRAAQLQQYIGLYGEGPGLARWNDLHYLNHPDEPPTVPEDYDWRTEPSGARDDEVIASKDFERDARLSLPADAIAVAAPAEVVDRASTVGTLAQLRLVDSWEQAAVDADALEAALDRIPTPKWGSYWQLIGPRYSVYDNAMTTGGPQIDFNAPAFIWEGAMHAADGSWDAIGQTALGAGPIFFYGHGPGFAWSVTNGVADINETFVVQLDPTDPRRYLYEGAYEPMDCRIEEYRARETPISVEQREICRTRHGIVMSSNESQGVAYVNRHGLFNREVQWVTAMFAMNGAKSIEDWLTAAYLVPPSFNMGYADDQGHIAYVAVGNHPRRADGVDIRLPLDGSTSATDWTGVLPPQQIPHAVDPAQGWMVNWNGLAARGFEGHWHFRGAHRQDVLGRTYTDPTVQTPYGGPVDANGDGLRDGGDLVRNLQYTAWMADYRNSMEFWRSAVPADEDLGTQTARDAAQLLRDWDGTKLHPSVALRVFNRWIKTDAIATVFADDLPDTSVIAPEDQLWMVFSPDATGPLQYDWLNGRTRQDVAVESFEATVAALAASYGDDVSTWPTQGAGTRQYIPANSTIFLLLLCDSDPSFCVEGTERGSDFFPGDAPTLPAWHRQVFNHHHTWLAPPTGSGVLGESPAESCSVLPPGNSGYISVAGQESAHYQDQHELYVTWQYKQSALTDAEVTRAVTGAPCVPGAAPASPVPTSLTYIGTVRGQGQTVHAAARLTTGDGRPLEGRTVTFTADDTTAEATTDHDGEAHVDLAVPNHGREVTVTASFTGHGPYQPSATSAQIRWGPRKADEQALARPPARPPTDLPSSDLAARPVEATEPSHQPLSILLLAVFATVVLSRMARFVRRTS